MLSKTIFTTLSSLIWNRQTRETWIYASHLLYKSLSYQFDSSWGDLYPKVFLFVCLRPWFYSAWLYVDTFLPFLMWIKIVEFANMKTNGQKLTRLIIGLINLGTLILLVLCSFLIKRIQRISQIYYNQWGNTIYINQQQFPLCYLVKNMTNKNYNKREAKLALYLHKRYKTKSLWGIYLIIHILVHVQVILMRRGVNIKSNNWDNTQKNTSFFLFWESNKIEKT